MRGWEGILTYITIDAEGWRDCSLSARGLWIELVSLVYGGEISVDSTPMREDELSDLASISVSDIERVIPELERVHVLSRAPGGLVFHDRLVAVAEEGA